MNGRSQKSRPQPDPPAPDPAAAREICLRLLERRPHTAAELAEALRKRGVPDEVAQPTLVRLSEVGLINDAEFAEAWVQSRRRHRHLGRQALTYELRRRGVADELIADATSAVTAEAEFAAAAALAERKLASLRHVAADVQARRLLAMLARKGYAAEVAHRAVREALADADTFAADTLGDTPDFGDAEL